MAVEHYVTAPIDELRRRVEARNKAPQWHDQRILRSHLEAWSQTFEAPGAAELALMKPGAILIQASRGGVVDETALAAALQSGHLGGAAIDVYSSEPPSCDNPLLKLTGEAADRTLLTPHIAGVTRQAAAFLFRSAWQNVERVLIEKRPPLNRVY